MATLVYPLRLKRVLAAMLVLGLLGACSSSETVYPESTNRKGAGQRTTYTDDGDTVFGPGGMNLFGEDDGPAQPGTGGGGIGVNTFLWRATLDTISFMPLLSADPFGGVIITDWYAPPTTLSERFKVTVYILGRDLRADGVRAAVFKQSQDAAGGWTDDAVNQQTAIELEDAILTRARQLRINAVQ